jgi:plasmid rolling circle replication initiator protein Rep
MGVESSTPDLYSETFGDGKNSEREHDNKLDRYSKAKLHQVAIMEYIEHLEGLRKEYEALYWCGRMLIFRLFQISRTYRLIGGCSCKKHLLCCLCALRRAARFSKEYERKIRQVLEEHPDWVPILITKTVVNGGSLEERFKHIVKGHKRMMVNRRNSLSLKSSACGLSANSVLRYVHGSAGSYEFKRGENSGLWHPHTHEIALLDGSRFKFTEEVRKGKTVESPLEFESKLSKEWHRATKDSFIVDVRRIDIGNEELFRKSICECFKYALKFTDLEPEDQVHAYKVLKGRHLIFSYGALRGVKINDSSVDSIEDALELEPYVDLIYTFSYGKYRFSEIADFGKIEKNKGKGNYSKKEEFFEIQFTDGSVINQKTVDDFVAGRREKEQADEVRF